MKGLVAIAKGRREEGKFISFKHTDSLCQFLSGFNPNWHEAGWIYPAYNVWIGICQLNFYQKFPNIF